MLPEKENLRLEFKLKYDLSGGQGLAKRWPNRFRSREIIKCVYLGNRI
jgi:hypothetical protein